MVQDFFPQGIAKGQSFIGREEEVTRLKKNIAAGHHTLLIAPRRYGKTSLAQNVISGLGILNNDVNFFLCRNGEAVERKIRACIAQALGKDDDLQEKVFSSLRDFFKHSKKKWTFGFKGVAGVELTPDDSDDVAGNIYTALTVLESTLNDLGKKAVLFFDEVQEIDLLDDGRQLQGAIREFAQISQHVVFIFSGSNRRLLHHMFDDSSMPLYELCEREQLHKISVNTYRAYLNHVASKTFDSPIDDSVLEAIFSITERHPKRVYNLCYQLWNDHPEGNYTVDIVKEAWDSLLKMRVKDVRGKLSNLNNSQLAVLTFIATGNDTLVTSRDAQNKVNLSSAAIVKAIRYLEDEDFIEKHVEGNFALIDPLIKDVLVKYENHTGN